MKSFKDLLSEVAAPKPEEEKKFKDQHKVDIAPHPVSTEFQHKGTVKPKAKRKADQEGDANYDAAYTAESVEDLDEDISKMTHGRLKWHMNTGVPHGSFTKDEMKKERDRRLNAGDGAAYKAAKASMNEEEVELDEAKIGDKIKYRNIKTRRVRTGIVKKVDIVNGQKRYEVYGNRYVGKYVYDDELLESVDLHEADIYSIKNTKTGQIYHNSKYPIDKNTQVYKKIKSAGGDHKHAAIHKNGKLVQEEVEDLDELSKKTLGSYVKKASSAAASDAAKYGQQGSSEKGLGHFRKAYNRLDNIRKATDRLTKEEVEQLDELSPNTLNSYVKKSAGNMAAHTAIAAAQASSSMGKSTPDVKRKIANRMKGIAGASNRLADKANMAENWQEEIPMMIRQLEFIAYAAEEIMDYVEMAGDPEEWFQNKISGIHQSMLSMYAYAQGGRRAGYGFDESVEEELKGGQKKLDHNKNGKIDAHDFHLMRKKKMKEEVDQIDELSQDKLQSYHAKAALDLRKKREKLDKGTLTMKDLKKGQNRVTGLNRAANKMEEVESLTQMLDEAVNVKGIQKAVDDGKSIDVIMTMFANKRTTNTDEIRKVVKDYNWKKRMKKEEVEMLDETFKQGVVKLKDGGSVVLKKEDADLLNQMFKDLSAGNRKKMQEVAMKDKAGFEEILGFAREAL
jgi:hypothetical protein